jgi:hypothetical protein
MSPYDSIASIYLVFWILSRCGQRQVDVLSHLNLRRCRAQTIRGNETSHKVENNSKSVFFQNEWLSCIRKCLPSTRLPPSSSTHWYFCRWIILVECYHPHIFKQLRVSHKAILFNRPIVAGAVLQSPPSLIHSFIHSFIKGNRTVADLRYGNMPLSVIAH